MNVAAVAYAGDFPISHDNPQLNVLNTCMHDSGCGNSKTSGAITFNMNNSDTYWT